MLAIDGSRGEGGGQVLRTALSLAMVRGEPFRIERIRARRARPGLMRQHLAAVIAARRVAAAEVEGAELGSTALVFRPGPIAPGSYHFSIGSGGSACLVLQTVLPPLLVASGPSRITVEGGTHNPMAPPFDFLTRVFLPLVSRMGPSVAARLERHGFVPAGGGRFVVDVTPCRRLSPLELLESPVFRERRARAVLANLPRHIGERELAVVRTRLGWTERECAIEEVEAAGSGNVLLLEVASAATSELVAGFGARGVPAEKVAGVAVAELRAFLDAGVPVGRHLADQFLVPLALAGGGAFRTMTPSEHLRTNIDVIETFGAARIAVREADAAFVVEVSPT